MPVQPEKAGSESDMMIRCDICGQKVFTACTDSQWPYRYKGKRFCSEDCRTVHLARDLHKINFANLGEQDMQGIYPVNYIPVKDGPKEERDEDMRGQKLITDEQKQKAIETALEGGDPIKYLKECGAKNTWGNWGWIKMQLEKKDPEKYKRMMEALGQKPATVERADKLPKVERKAEEQKPLAKVVRKEITKDGVKVEAKLLVPKEEFEKALNGGTKKALDFKVIGIETKLGKFQYDSASDQMRWMPKNSTVVIMMQSEDWEKLAEDLPEIMKAIGATDREDDEE